MYIAFDNMIQLCLSETYNKCFQIVKTKRKKYVNKISNKYYQLYPPFLTYCVSDYLFGAQFSYPGVNTNKVMKIINGNGRLGFKLGLWNCRKGLVTEEKYPSHKVEEIKVFFSLKMSICFA